MPTSSYRAAARKREVQPAPSAAQIRSRVIKRLLRIAEDEGERPEAAIVACRVLLDLAPGRGRPAGEYAGNIKTRQAAAVRLLDEAFAEIALPEPEPPLELAPPADVPVVSMTEAIPEPVIVTDVPDEGVEHVEVEPSAPVRLSPEQVVPFARKYGRKLARGY